MGMPRGETGRTAEAALAVEMCLGGGVALLIMGDGERAALVALRISVTSEEAKKERVGVAYRGTALSVLLLRLSVAPTSLAEADRTILPLFWRLEALDGVLERRLVDG